MNPRFATLAALVLTAAALRLLPHGFNFTPVAAMALFAGARFADKRTAFLLPLAARGLTPGEERDFTVSSGVRAPLAELVTAVGFVPRLP